MWAKVLVTSLIPQNVVSDDQKIVRQGDRGPFGSSPRCQPTIQSRQIVVLLRRDGPSCLAQAAAQPQTPFSDLAALALACALMTARTQPGPTGQVLSIGELVHVQPDLGQESPGGHAVHPGDGAQPSDLTLKRA